MGGEKLTSPRTLYRLKSSMQRAGSMDIVIQPLDLADLCHDAGEYRMSEHFECFTERRMTVHAAFVDLLIRMGERRAALSNQKGAGK